MKLKRGDLIEVHWYDAYTPTITGWLLEDEHEANIHPIKTCGYFWEKKNGYIFTYSAMSINDDIKPSMTNAFHIPVGCIKKIIKK